MINREDLLSGTRPEVGNRVLVTEKETFEGNQVMDYKGVVWGISMRAKDIVQDTMMGCKNVTGGELSSWACTYIIRKEGSYPVSYRGYEKKLYQADQIGKRSDTFV